MRNVTETVKHLLIINGIFFLATITLGNQVYDWFALHYPENPKFEIWQPLTHMFMHGDISHIFFNMFGLWMFGTPLGTNVGQTKIYFFFYLSTGIGAAALQLLLYYYQVDHVNSALSDYGLTAPQISTFYQTAELPTAAIDRIGEGQLSGAFNSFRSVMVGASGALYGVLVGFAMLFPNAQLMLLFPPIPVKAKFLVPILDISWIFSLVSPLTPLALLLTLPMWEEPSLVWP